MTFLHKYKKEFAIAILAFIVHTLCFFAVLHANNGSVLATIHGDDGYLELAQNVLSGNGFSWSSTSPYAPNPLRTPGYIYILVGLFSITGSVVATAFIQFLASCAIPVFGMWIAQHITRSSRISLVTGIILALDPTLALLSFQFFTETMFLLLFLPWLLLTFKYLTNHDYRILIASAILLGFAILTKTSAQYIPFIFTPFIVWSFGKNGWRHSLAHTSTFLLIVGAILSPWVIRNITTFGEPGLSAQTPFVLYTNLAPAVLSVAHNTLFADEVKNFLTPAEFKGDSITLANGGTYTTRALEVVWMYPVATAYIAAKSLFTFFTNDGFFTLLMRSGYTPSDFFPLLLGARLVWITITLAAFAGGLIYLFKERTPLAILIVLLCAYFALSSTIAAFGTNPRYRLPIDPIILAFAATGALHARTYIQRFRNKLQPPPTT